MSTHGSSPLQRTTESSSNVVDTRDTPQPPPPKRPRVFRTRKQTSENNSEAEDETGRFKPISV